MQLLAVTHELKLLLTFAPTTKHTANFILTGTSIVKLKRPA